VITPTLASEPPADAPAFHPFYEGFANAGARGPVKILIAFGSGLGFLLLRVLADQQHALVDWSVMLAALITIALLALYLATHTFRVLLTDVQSRVGESAYNDLLTRAQAVLNDRRLALAGGFFACLNVVIALALGVPRGSTFSQATLIVGYAAAGFVCGMAAYCISGVHSVLQRLPYHMSHEKAFDYTSPDGCGGTSFIGEALVVFGGVTLVVGVLISLYILNAPWSSAAAPRPWWLDSVVGFWLAFPYIMSAAAGILPAIAVHDALREYKRATDAVLWRELRIIEERLDDVSESSKRREDILRARRLDLHRMRLWPFDLGAYVTYGTLITPNLWATLHSAFNWYAK
jgi:hypothetical protein